MKKLVCLLVAMILCVSCVALAAAAPSKTTSDLNKTETKTETKDTQVTVDTTGFIIELVVEPTEENQELLDLAQKEIEKLAAAQPIESYFGELVDEEGNVIDLKAVLEADVLNVHEFHPVSASGYSEEFGDVTVTFLFPTPYEVGEKVWVMIGIVTFNEADETYTIAWKAFEGVGVEVAENEVEAQGAIEVVLDPETVLAIQEGVALLAVVSK